MAAVTELSFLLFVLINNIQAEEFITIREEGGFYSFNPPEKANLCLISRFVGEEQLVLWNTSDLWPENSTVPADLKRRLLDFGIANLTHSDSALYQEKCWTEGKVTHESNISIIICGKINEKTIDSVKLGQTVDLPCKGAADNLMHQWLKQDFRFEQETWTRVFGDSTTSVMDNVKGKFQVVKNTSALRVHNVTMSDFSLYNCLVMNQQQCVCSSTVQLLLELKVLYYSVEDKAVLQCTDSDFSEDDPPLWGINLKTYLGRNHSLVFSSLTLNHSGVYLCSTSRNIQLYYLVVCPKLGPLVVQLFSEGEDITLTCSDSWREGMILYWFIKSNQTQGEVFSVYERMSNPNRFSSFYSNGSLIISNVSLKDTGEYWCAVTDPDLQCVSTTKYLLMYREPFGIYSTFYKVWSSVLSALLLMLCVVVVVVIQRTRREEQLPAETQFSYYSKNG